MLSEFQHPAAHQRAMISFDQNQFTLWMRDLGGKLVFDAKCRRKGKDAAFLDICLDTPEQIFNETALKMCIHPQIFTEELLKLFRTHMNSFLCTDLGGSFQCLIQARSRLTAFS